MAKYGVGEHEFIYVADSALATKDNLLLMKDDIYFITRLPENFGVCTELIDKAVSAAGSWQDIGQLSQLVVKSRNICASYRIQETNVDLAERSYRALIVHSDAPDRRRRKRIDKAVQKDRTILSKAAYELSRKKFFCLPDAPGGSKGFRARRFPVYRSRTARAAADVPEIDIHLGNFLAKNQWRPVVTLPFANRQIDNGSGPVIFASGDYTVHPDAALPNCQWEIMPVGSYPPPGSGNAPTMALSTDAIKVRVHAMEEKGSDVNLACHLVNDAWAGRFNAAMVISNDTDLVEPIRIVTQELKKNVLILSTSKFGASPPLQKVATSVVHIHNSHLKAAQFPSAIPGTTIVKPASW